MVSTEVTSGVTSATDEADKEAAEADSAISEYAHVKDQTQEVATQQVSRPGRVMHLERQVHGLKAKLRHAARRTRRLIKKVKAAAKRSLKTAKKVLRKAHKKAKDAREKGNKAASAARKKAKK